MPVTVGVIHEHFKWQKHLAQTHTLTLTGIAYTFILFYFFQCAGCLYVSEKIVREKKRFLIFYVKQSLVWIYLDDFIFENHRSMCNSKWWLDFSFSDECLNIYIGNALSKSFESIARNQCVCMRVNRIGGKLVYVSRGENGREGKKEDIQSIWSNHVTMCKLSCSEEERFTLFMWMITYRETEKRDAAS